MYCVSLVLLLFAYVPVYIHAQELPEGSIVPANQTVLNGSSVTFYCRIPGTTYNLWYSNGQILQRSESIDPETPQLIINPVDYRAHRGTYYCLGVNTSTSMSYETPTVYLNVQYMEDDFQEEPPPTISAIAGHIVMINCSGPSAYPPITQVTWYKWNSSGPFPISQTSRVQIRENGQLVFENPMQTDSGPYFCGVSNGVFSRNSSSTLLFVNTVEPEVSIWNVTGNADQLYPLPGQNVLLECSLHARVVPETAMVPLYARFTWYYEGRLIMGGGPYRIFPNGSLLISGVSKSIEGAYSCTGSLENWKGEDTDIIHVFVATIGGSVSISPASDVRGRDSEARFTCVPPEDAKPEPVLRWIRNGAELKNSTHVTVSSSGKTLILSPLRLSDEGNYSCQAENVAGNVSATTFLTVEDYPTVAVTTQPIRESSTVTLNCSSSSPTVTDFKWFFGSNNITSSEKYTLLGGGSSLMIRNITEDDIGDYVCETHDSVHVPRRGTGSLQFTDELYLKNRPPNVMELVNRTVTFTCEFRSHHLNSWTVTWFHGNPEVVEDSRRTFTSAANGDHSLTIRNLTVADHGMYTCKGVLNNTLKNNEIEEEIASFNLTSIVPLSFEKKPPSRVAATVGQKVLIDCLPRGHPKPEIAWEKIDQHSIALNTLANGSLLISSAKQNDSGRYGCTVVPFDPKGSVPLYAVTQLMVDSSTPPTTLPTDTIVIIVVGAIAILLYLVIFIICLCVCAKCYRSSLRRKKLELVAMENEHARLSRKMSDAKDNSAILRHPGTPMLNTGPIHAPSSMYTVPRTPSPHETRRMETAFVDGRSAYPIPSPLPPVPTVVSDATELPNFPRGNLKLGDRLGEGEFGPVLIGQAFGMTNDRQPMDVAIKVWLHPRDEDEETAENDLLNFYSQMRLKFENIACIIGMCTDVEPYYIIYEYLDRGDLKQFLLECRPDELDIPVLTQENLLHIVRQVANGMAYLSSQMIIHGDIAARNCLVSSDLRVKVADLGIGHDVYRDDYYDNGEQLLPVRWMPPEILGMAEFTLHSDIWSFGIFCWEVFAFGRLPYDDITDEEVLRLVPQGLRPEVPEEGCPLSLYSLMRDCWSPHPETRPKFTQLVVAIIDLNLD